MANSSFYGGRPGFSCVIVRSFPSIQEMINNFKLGGDYSEVHYNEYVLINTPDKNDINNGKIYRRGYDYTNELGGAIYIGSIVGPAGKAPQMKMDSIEKIKEKSQTGGNPDRYSEGEYKPLTDLVPGKDGEKYNDVIKWASYSMQDPNNEEDTIAYIGFIFPYLVEDFISESVDAYTTTELVTREDERDHPFYQQWKIKIPKGIKGDSLKNFRVIQANNDVEPYNNQEDDVENGREILVYDYYNYDESKEGTSSTIYLGDYNMIDTISINEDGTFTINYTHDDDAIFEKLFKWIKNVTLDTETGQFTVTYNQEIDKEGQSTTYQTYLKWVKNITIDESGNVNLEYSNGDPQVLETQLKWVKSIQMGSDGTITVTYNDNSTEDFKNNIKWIDNVTLDEDGTFTVHYNNGQPDYETKLKWVADIQINDNGDITILYNDSTTYEYNGYLKIITDVSIETNKGEEGEGTGSQKVKITYNTGDSQEIGNPLNYIVETDVSDNYHLLVYYSDPEKRASIPEDKKVNHKEKDGWLDLGSIKDADGILIGLNINIEEHPELIDIASTIEYLNKKYPIGLIEPGVEGKIITVGSENEEKNKDFYAFNYDKSEIGDIYKGWYYLGSFGETIKIDSLFIVGKEDDEVTKQKAKALLPNGIWFVIEGENE